MSILMNLYKEEILDVDDILAWHAAIQHQDDMKKIVSKVGSLHHILNIAHSLNFLRESV